jgi:hypothetical protein
MMTIAQESKVKYEKGIVFLVVTLSSIIEKKVNLFRIFNSSKPQTHGNIEAISLPTQSPL